MNDTHQHLPDVVVASVKKWEQNHPRLIDEMAAKSNVGELEQLAEEYLRHARAAIVHHLANDCHLWAHTAGAYVLYARLFAARSLQLQGVTPEEWMLPFSNMEDDA